jgi:hypothetical protein
MLIANKLLKQIADEISAALPPLREGYYVKPSDDNTGNILIGNNDLAFVITRLDIEGNLHIEKATKSFPVLLSAIAQHHAVIAAETDLKVATDIVETYARS